MDPATPDNPDRTKTMNRLQRTLLTLGLTLGLAFASCLASCGGGGGGGGGGAVAPGPRTPESPALSISDATVLPQENEVTLRVALDHGTERPVLFQFDVETTDRAIQELEVRGAPNQTVASGVLTARRNGQRIVVGVPGSDQSPPEGTVCEVKVTLPGPRRAKTAEVRVRNVVMCDVDGASIEVDDEPVVGTVTIQ